MLKLIFYFSMFVLLYYLTSQCSSVVRSLVAKARVPGFVSTATTDIFSHILPLLLSRPL